MAVVLYGEGVINVHISLFPGVDGGYNMTVTFPEGLATGQRGGQPRPQAQPRPRGAQAENWRRLAAIPLRFLGPRRSHALARRTCSLLRRAPPCCRACRPGPQAAGRRQQQRAQTSEPQQDALCASAPQDGGGGGKDAGGGCARGARPDRRGGARRWLPCSCSCCYCNARSSLLPPPGGGDAGREAGGEGCGGAGGSGAGGRRARNTTASLSHGDRVLSSFGQAWAGATLMGLCRVVGRVIFFFFAGRQEGAGGGDLGTHGPGISSL